MPVSIHEDKIRVDNKRDALKYLLILRCHQRNIKISMADIDVLIELNETGYGREFYDNCVTKGFFGSKQTVVNAIGRLKDLDLVRSERKGEAEVNREFFPELKEDKILVKYMVGNL